MPHEFIAIRTERNTGGGIHRLVVDADDCGGWMQTQILTCPARCESGTLEQCWCSDRACREHHDIRVDGQRTCRYAITAAIPCDPFYACIANEPSASVQRAWQIGEQCA